VSGGLREPWEANAERWIAWARTPGHDSYWRFHRDQFLELLPPPGRLAVDLGCGEGRLPRDLKARGYAVVGVEASPTLARAAREADPSTEVLCADAAAVPLPDGCADLALAFMSLHDMDDPAAAVREASRLLEPGGRFCVAIVHPLNSAGRFEGDEPDSPFTIRDAYLSRHRYADSAARDGLEMTFESAHRPLEDYVGWLADAGFLVERLREPAMPDGAFVEPRGVRWQRVPLFLHLRAVRV
jgi:SAM-dependent methyltransferase